MIRRDLGLVATAHTEAVGRGASIAVFDRNSVVVPGVRVATRVVLCDSAICLPSVESGDGLSGVHQT